MLQNGKKDNIYVAGHTGMVGSAICRQLKKENYKYLNSNSCELSLDNEQEVQRFFLKNKIDYVF